MAIFNNLTINSISLLEPNSFSVSEAVQFDTVTNMLGDEIVIERKGSNYIKASISISWNAVDASYAQTISGAITSLNTITRGTDTWSNMKLTSFNRELVDEARHQAKRNNVLLYNVSAEFQQITSSALH